MGMDVSGRNPSKEEGEYFRASVWSWRPLHALCETVMHQEYPDWGYNDGKGFATQAECTELADRLDAYIKAFPTENIALESDMRVDADGKFLPKNNLEGESPYSIRPEHLQKFITFLRSCGGFEIW